MGASISVPEQEHQVSHSGFSVSVRFYPFFGLVVCFLTQLRQTYVLMDPDQFGWNLFFLAYFLFWTFGCSWATCLCGHANNMNACVSAYSDCGNCFHCKREAQETYYCRVEFCLLLDVDTWVISQPASLHICLGSLPMHDITKSSVSRHYYHLNSIVGWAVV